VENQSLDGFIKLLLRSYSGVFTEFSIINEAELAKRSGLKEQQVIAMLNQLQQAGILSYSPRPAKPQVIYAVERLDQANLRISPENYHERKRQAQIRIDSVSNYVQSDDTCRSQLLLRYFGESAAPRCGRCDVCLERNKMKLNELEFDQINRSVRELLGQRPMTLPELYFESRLFPEDHIIQVLRWLIDKGAVTRDEQQVYHLRKQFRIKF
jgi:ATP-dependent DNA helicase RecQ